MCSLSQPFGCNPRRSDGITFSERLFYLEGMNYRVGSHTKFKIEYHVVWATKYRYPLLNGEIAQRVRELTRQICERLERHILPGG